MPVTPEQQQIGSYLFTGISPAMASCRVSHAPNPQPEEHDFVTDGKALVLHMFLVDTEATCVMSRAR